MTPREKRADEYEYKDDVKKEVEGWSMPGDDEVRRRFEEEERERKRRLEEERKEWERRLREEKEERQRQLRTEREREEERRRGKYEALPLPTPTAPQTGRLRTFGPTGTRRPYARPGWTGTSPGGWRGWGVTEAQTIVILEYPKHPHPIAPVLLAAPGRRLSLFQN